MIDNVIQSASRTRSVYGYAAGALLSAAMVFTVSAGLAQDTTESENQSPPVLQPWTVNCGAAAGEKELTCSMQQALRVRQTGQLVVSATLFYDAQQRLMMRLNLPHRIFLPEGVSIMADDTTLVRSDIQLADANGSYASMPVTQSMLDALKRGNELKITAVAENRKPIVFQLSLLGFSAAFARL